MHKISSRDLSKKPTRQKKQTQNKLTTAPRKQIQTVSNFKPQSKVNNSITTQTKRHVSLYQAASAQTAKLNESNNDPISPLMALSQRDDENTSLQSMLQADVDENVSHGAINFSSGRVVFDARSSLHNFARFRVVEHISTELTHKEQDQLQNALNPHNLTSRRPSPSKPKLQKAQQTIYYSFQEVFDDGNEEHDDPYINLKSVIKAGSNNVNTLHLSSTTAMVNGLAFNSHSPQQVLYIGNWGGVLPQYISTKIGADVEILDPDAMSQYMSKTYSPGIFYENSNNNNIVTQPRLRVGLTKELPDHPFDIIFQHKTNVLARYKQKKLFQLGGGANNDGDGNTNNNNNNIGNDDNGTIFELTQDEVESILNQDDAQSPLVSTGNDQYDSTIGINQDESEQAQQETEHAHTQLLLQQAIVSFQHARLRGVNTGAIATHPSMVDTHSHLSSLYSQHYLDPSNAIPTAIQYIQHKRHVKHLETQLEQTKMNIKAMVMEKFNLLPLLLSQPDHPHFRFKFEHDQLAQEIVSLRGELFELQHESIYNSDNSPNNSHGAPIVQDKKRQKAIIQLQEILEKKSATLLQLKQMLEQVQVTPTELQAMSEMVIKWLSRRLNSIQNFSTKEVEMFGGSDDEGGDESEHLSENDDEFGPKHGKSGKSGKSGKNGKKKINSNEDNTLGESLNDIFDEAELNFASEFNNQFIKIMIMGQDGEFSDNDEMRQNSPDQDNNFGDDLGDDFGNDFDDDSSQLNPHDVSNQGLKKMYNQFVENQSMDGIWFQSSLFSLQRYQQIVQSNQDITDKLQTRIDTIGVPQETVQILTSIHQNILDSIYLPMKGYDSIIHDHNNDPLTPETLRLIKEALIVEGDDGAIRNGVFIKRSSLASPEIIQQFDSLEQWLPNIDQDVARLKKVFKHVYWQQPSHDHVVFAATDAQVSSDLNSTHPLDPDQVVDISVALWQTGAFGLDVVEVSDKWQYIGGGPGVQNIAHTLSHKPEDFFHDGGESEM
jgi:hypothetical protein